MSLSLRNDAARLISLRQPFKVASMSAHRIPAAQASTGRAPEQDVRELRASGASYVVYSYGTPIAWATEDGALHTTTTRYSVTTSRHQSICRRASI